MENTHRWGRGHDQDVQVGASGNSVQCTTVTARYASALDIVVARSDDYADALAATPLADIVNAPVLINPSAALDPRNASEITRLAAGYDRVQVHLLGGTSALSASVQSAIAGLRGVDVVTRHAGQDRYGTAVALAWTAVYWYGLEYGTDGVPVHIYLTTGTNFPDALAAGTAAAGNTGVVLLTADATLGGATARAVEELTRWVHVRRWQHGAPKILAVGGPAVAAARSGGLSATSLMGADRYQTAVKVAAQSGVDPQSFAVVPGANFPDAVVASAYIANADGVLLLSKPDQLTPSTANFLRTNLDAGDQVIAFGGPQVLSQGVVTGMAGMLP